MRRLAGAIDEHLVSLLRVPAPELEDYHTLRYALEERGVGDTFRVIAVTSPVVGDGKTTTAINLAGVLAHRRNARVLLIDADLRCPSVAAALGFADDPDRAGVVDVIQTAHLRLSQAVTRMADFNLSVLASSRPADDPVGFLGGPGLPALLQEARRQFDVIVLDTSPLLLVPDSRMLENWVDGTLLVVAAHRTPRKLVGDALNLLNRSRLIGVVFNGDDRPLGGYHAYYGAYGYRESPRGTHAAEAPPR